ncbi:MAG TPA: FkbM family methyltransferase [Spirochaetota bacterium]|nr:FkbM family methyltransferase [Spirochaetota bacterium]
MKQFAKRWVNKLGLDLRRYSSTEEFWFKKFIERHNIGLVLDVGANKGQYHSFLRHAGYAGRVISFEPLSEAYSELLMKSRTDPLWDIVPRCAVGESDGIIELNVSKNGVSSSILPIRKVHLDNAPDSRYIGAEKVECFSLKSLWPALKMVGDTPVLLKIDSQGYEDRILRGLGEFVAGVAAVQLELSSVELYSGQLLLPDMIKEMSEYGYRMEALFPAFISPKTGQVLQYEGFFVRSPVK